MSLCNPVYTPAGAKGKFTKNNVLDIEEPGKADILYTRPEIETMLQLSPGDYQRALLQLQTAWEEYNKEIF